MHVIVHGALVPVGSCLGISQRSVHMLTDGYDHFHILLLDLLRNDLYYTLHPDISVVVY